MPLDILFEDEHLVAINKPHNLLVHHSPMAAEIKEAALQQLRDQLGHKVYPMHRLDRPTSGVLIFAKNSEAAKLGQVLFEASSTTKEYLAVVRGFAPESITLDREVQAADSKKAKAAKTHFIRLNTIELPHAVHPYNSARYSLIKAQPFTGRMHQIRLHLRHLRHVIVGDKKYGDRYHNRFIAAHYGWPQLFLHANILQFDHPIEHQKRITVKAPLPAHFQQLLKTFDWEKS